MLVKTSFLTGLLSKKRRLGNKCQRICSTILERRRWHATRTLHLFDRMIPIGLVISSVSLGCPTKVIRTARECFLFTARNCQP